MLEMIMAYVSKAFAHVHEREEGQALVEYALILTLVSIASILILTALGTAVGNALQTVVTAL
jgi:Flp pilus assembly pilin Flp